MTAQTKVKWEWSIQDTGVTGYKVLEDPAESFEAAKTAIEAYLAKNPKNTCLRGIIGKIEATELGPEYTMWMQDGEGQWRIWE